MWVPAATVAQVFGLPRVWAGAIAAVIGLTFWIVGLVVLNWLFERYVRDDPDDEPDDG